jgi:Tol biopolymer transport system component
MLYELCTGTRPFRGDSHASVLAEVLKQEPSPPGDLRPDLPAELGRLIMRCLRKDPERRVQSMADLKVALEELREEVDSGSLTSQLRAGGPVTPPTPATTTVVTTRRRSWQVAAAGALAVAAIVGGVYAWRSRAPAPPPMDVTVQPVPLTSYPGIERPGNFSPDGNQLVFSWDGDRQDNFDIYVKLIGPGPPLRVTTDPAPDFAPRWSPDGRTVAFVRWIDRETVAVMLVPPLGGQERKVAQFQTRVVLGAQLTSLCWSSDSKHLLVSGGQGADEPNHIYRLSIDTGEITRLASVEGIGDGYTSLDLSPDGKTLAAVRLDSSGSRRLELITLSSAFDREGSTELKGLGANVGGARWTADGRQLVYAVSVNNPLPLYRYALGGGEPTPMTWVGAGAWSPAIARQGNRLVFARDFRDTNIWRVALDPGGAAAGPPEQLASSSFREVFPQYSPDGRRLAFFSNRGGSVQVWTSDVDGSKAVPLTAMHAMATTGSPRWSPDGQRIAFDSNASGSYHIYEISADGGQPRALTSGASSNFIASWSPDGRWIYFSSDRSGRLEVWRMPAGGGEPEQVTREGGQASTVTPDGQWVYFTKKDGADGLWRLPAGGGAESRVLERVFRYNFVPTGKGIYYVAAVSGDRTSAVNFLDFRTGETRQIVPLDRIPDLGLALSPDGRSLLFTTIDYLGTDLMLVEGFR